MRQRLIVCLDGTWNRQDSSTNVLHHFNLVREGPAGPDIAQKRYYHAGVGTGVLDSVTGGGFGFGLEQNVRDAYNWLVENYCHGEPDGPADEIFIFGFSRGAFTARSLVGFIAQCGLLRRGAPVTVEQLWERYCVLGRVKEERRSPWDIFKQDGPQVRPIAEIAFGASDAGERLLLRWSRRVNIAYLGVYDTVGAIGFDALAIPGLESKMALHNNMRPTTIIQKCRHALAIDEHRANFNHTPFMAFVGNDEGETNRAIGPVADADAWNRTREMWRTRIEQRWFVGAHSNVGGGYPDNLLARIPLAWLLEGAPGLAYEPVSKCEAIQYLVDGPPRDSYAEFAKPLWTSLIRAKRNYRCIDPDPEPMARASRQDRESNPTGFTVETINETVDESVCAYWANSNQPIPPNLYGYLRRKGKDVPAGALPPKHKWLDGGFWSAFNVVLWASMAVAGVYAIDRTGDLSLNGIPWLLACAVAAALPVADWWEHRQTFEFAMGSRTPARRAFLDSVYWTRILGFVLFAVGMIAAVVELPHQGWTANSHDVLNLMQRYSLVPVAAMVATLALAGFRIRTVLGAVSACVAIPAAMWLLFAAGGAACAFFPESSCGVATFAMPTPRVSVPGVLLLLQISILYMWRSQIWAGEPMTKANLGSIVALQLCPTPAKVAAQFARWRGLLANPRFNPADRDEVNGPAARRLRDVVRECLWRDIFGFIPVYVGVYAFALYFAHRFVPALHVVFDSLPWWLIPATAAVTDYLEDICHLRYCALHAQGRTPPLALTLFSFTMSLIKIACVLSGLVLTIASVAFGTAVVVPELHDWRAKLVLLGSNAAVLLFVLAIVAAIVTWYKSAKKGGPMATPTSGSMAAATNA